MSRPTVTAGSPTARITSAIAGAAATRTVCPAARQAQASGTIGYRCCRALWGVNRTRTSHQRFQAAHDLGGRRLGSDLRAQPVGGVPIGGILAQFRHGLADHRTAVRVVAEVLVLQ